MTTFSFGEYADGEPYVQFQGELEFIANLDNSTLFSHSEEYKDYDHFFVELSQDEERYRNIGAFVWRFALADFDSFANYLIENDFTHLHTKYPSQNDVESFDATHKRMLAKAEQEIDAEVAEEMSHFDEEIEGLLGE
jgi:hypothetical protein